MLASNEDGQWTNPPRRDHSATVVLPNVVVLRGGGFSIVGLSAELYRRRTGARRRENDRLEDGIAERTANCAKPRRRRGGRQGEEQFPREHEPRIRNR